MGVHGSREAPERLALRGELVEAMPQLNWYLRAIGGWWSRALMCAF